MAPDFDLLIIGGGINGVGIARDAAGRGLSVCLAEMNDLGSATSGASTKLFHGGLRYLEYFEFRLVREALMEREVLLRAMPHISWPMRFVLPYHHEMRFDSETPTSKLLSYVMPWMKGRRPAWLIRLGLFIYDNLGGRDLLPATTSMRLQGRSEGAPLKPEFQKAYEYSDCWVEDSRLVVLNARDAEAKGASIRPRTKVTSATVEDGIWRVSVNDRVANETYDITAKMVVNAAGPWVGDVLRGTLKSNQQGGVRLVRGSHIVTRKLFDHDKSYFFQGIDGRIIFAIPYETDFTLIGTTDSDHADADERPQITEAEQSYLIEFINQYLAKSISEEDVVWTYSGVRPLYDDGAKSATATTREYVLNLDKSRGAAALHIFGGKITTYRKLAEAALEKVAGVFPQIDEAWTAGVALPGGDFPVDGFDALVDALQAEFMYLNERWAKRLVRAYGTEARDILGDAVTRDDLGADFGSDLTQREVEWLIHKEYARTADDVLWRRSKLGLRLREAQIQKLDNWMADYLRNSFPAAAE
ncbi:glycerol-3-phosphate dehydrogenase [Roseovarius phycicola]|uniref:Glycerol-3-phosphate dehydrogenase n=1 Tax=Roseovarius phycicola TaxID=3080976 RepID=A0ABZ2HFA2_9RHOB